MKDAVGAARNSAASAISAGDAQRPSHLESASTRSARGRVDTPMLRSDIQLESQNLGRPFEEIKANREADASARVNAITAPLVAPYRA